MSSFLRRHQKSRNCCLQPPEEFTTSREILLILKASKLLSRLHHCRPQQCLRLLMHGMRLKEPLTCKAVNHIEEMIEIKSSKTTWALQIRGEQLETDERKRSFPREQPPCFWKTWPLRLSHCQEFGHAKQRVTAEHRCLMSLG